MTSPPEVPPKVEFVQTRAEVKNQLSTLTTQLTGQTQFLAIGIIAGAWALLSNPPVSEPFLLTLAILVAVAVLCCDFLQYALPFLYFSRLEKKLRRSEADKVPHNDRSLLYSGRWFFFGAKVVLVIVVSGIFCAAIAIELGNRGASKMATPAPNSAAAPASH